MGKWLKFKFYLFVYFWYSVIFANIFICAWFNHRMWETVGLLVAYFTLRYMFPRTFHCKKFFHCIFFSTATFWLVIPAVLPLSISIFSSIFFGALIGLVLCKIEEHEEKGRRELENTIFELPLDKQKELIANTNLSEEERKAVELRLIEHLKGTQWYDAMGYSKRNCQYLYKHGIEKLNKRLH